jgi:hypothetical protein
MANSNISIVVSSLSTFCSRHNRCLPHGCCRKQVQDSTPHWRMERTLDSSLENGAHPPRNRSRFLPSRHKSINFGLRLLLRRTNRKMGSSTLLILRKTPVKPNLKERRSGPGRRFFLRKESQSRLQSESDGIKLLIMSLGKREEEENLDLPHEEETEQQEQTGHCLDPLLRG